MRSPPPPGEEGEGLPHSLLLLPCSLPHQHPCPSPRPLDSPGFLYLPLPGSPGQAKWAALFSASGTRVLGMGGHSWSWSPVYPFQVPARLLQSFLLRNLGGCPTPCRSHVSLAPRAVFIHTCGTFTLTPACSLSACLSFSHSHPSSRLTKGRGLHSHSLQGLCS